MDLKVGITGEAQDQVTGKNTASSMGSGGIDVYATPAMIALMEKAAAITVQPYLPEGSSTVGTMVNIKHIAATPVGMNITAKAELIEVNEKRLIFKIEAYDDKEKIGEGTHERYIIAIDKFIARVNNKNVE